MKHKLPTDEEIIGDLETDKRQSESREYDIGFCDGAIWMRDTYAKPILEEMQRLGGELAMTKEALKIRREDTAEYFKENEKLKKQLEVAVDALKTSIYAHDIVVENAEFFECENDEDCDHCCFVEEFTEVKKALKTIESLERGE
jgi:hypothetical protein